MDKKLRLRLALIAAALIICLILVWLLCSFNGRPRSRTLQDRGEILSHLMTDDCQTSYTVLVYYDLSSTGLDWQTHSISNVSIVVRRSTLKSFKDVFTTDYRRTWKTTNPGLPPTWADRYVPSADFILPTGRTLVGEEGQVYLIVFDGSECKLYLIDTKAKQFEACPRSPSIDRMLTEYYSHAFDPEDVYWDLALVKCAEFFGKKSQPVNFSPHAKLEDLYTQWKEIYWSK